jgi:hypothetical protein
VANQFCHGTRPSVAAISLMCPRVVSCILGNLRSPSGARIGRKDHVRVFPRTGKAAGTRCRLAATARTCRGPGRDRLLRGANGRGPQSLAKRILLRPGTPETWSGEPGGWSAPASTRPTHQSRPARPVIIAAEGSRLRDNSQHAALPRIDDRA